MASVTLRHVSKQFGSVSAVRDVNLEIADQEFLVLLGPSGCGKTTTLRMVAGLEALSSGSIHIGNRDVSLLPPKDRDIAMVFQSYALYPHMTVADNMAFGLKLRHIPKTTIDERVRHAAEILDLSPLLGRRPKELSGGQRQRVALGRAIVREPQAFLMDEPLSNLDAKLRTQTRVELKRLHQRLGATILYVTHDQTEAMTMGTRIVIMRDGVVQQADTPDGIYNRPANQFVATFVGMPPMNLLNAEATRDKENLVAMVEGQPLRLPPHLRAAIETLHQTNVTLGIRPEDIALDGGTDAAGIGLQATVRLIEPLGHEQMVYCDVGTHSIVLRVKSDWQGRNGDSVRLALNAERLYAFDPTNETALRTWPDIEKAAQ